MGWNSIVYDQDPTGWYSRKSVQIENTWIWSTQNCFRIVRHGDSSKDIDAQLSKIEDDGEKKHTSETSIRKFWRQTRENRNRSSGQESKGIISGVEGGKGISYQWKEEGQCSQGDQCSFRHESNNRAQQTEPKCRHTFRAINDTRSKRVTDLRRRLKDKSDAPAETRGNLPRMSIISKKTKLHSSRLPMSGCCRPHPQ